jgi:succinoglycan biosynthesis protein ExoA
MSFNSPAIDNTKVVVVIPALNEAHTIEAIVRKLVSEHRYLPNINIVVADGGSTDATKATALALSREFDFVHVMDNPKKIQSAGVNMVAIEWQDKAEVMVRCDAHAIYPEGFVSKLLTSLKKSQAASVVIPMDSIGNSMVQTAIAWTSDSSIGSGGSAHRGGRKSGYVDHGHHAAFDMKSFLAVNGYDETFAQNEDAEFDCRLRAQGFKIYLDAHIRIKYLPRSSFLKLWNQYFGYGMGRSRTVLKHPASLRVRQLAVPIHILAIAVSLLLFAVYRLPFFLAWPVLYSLLLFTVSVMTMNKRKSTIGLLTGFAAFIMHTSWGLGFLTGIVVNIRRVFQTEPQAVLVPGQ